MEEKTANELRVILEEEFAKYPDCSNIVAVMVKRDKGETWRVDLITNSGQASERAIAIYQAMQKAYKLPKEWKN